VKDEADFRENVNSIRRDPATGGFREPVLQQSLVRFFNPVTNAGTIHMIQPYEKFLEIQELAIRLNKQDVAVGEQLFRGMYHGRAGLEARPGMHELTRLCQEIEEAHGA
jgi:hypothetical protein